VADKTHLNGGSIKYGRLMNYRPLRFARLGTFCRTDQTLRQSAESMDTGGTRRNERDMIMCRAAQMSTVLMKHSGMTVLVLDGPTNGAP
jgi:hypothetical protein